jgi:cell division protease FtsH
MAKEDKQPPKFPFQPVNGNDEKPQRKTPKFSLYWIYAIIFAVLIGFQFIGMKPEALQTTAEEFFGKMLKSGDVAKLDKVTNTNTVKIYIKSIALEKAFMPISLTSDLMLKKQKLHQFSSLK